MNPTPPPNHAIDYLEFATRDLAAAKTFLSSAFGWTFTDYGPEYTSFHDGRLAGGLRADPAAPAAANPLVVLFAANLENALERVRFAGGATLTAPPYEFPGGRRFEFTAPGGLALAVWSDRRADGTKIA
jgi:predicted enzyme related to lactoylglutathione lyase